MDAGRSINGRGPVFDRHEEVQLVAPNPQVVDWLNLETQQSDCLVIQDAGPGRRRRVTGLVLGDEQKGLVLGCLCDLDRAPQPSVDLQGLVIERVRPGGRRCITGGSPINLLALYFRAFAALWKLPSNCSYTPKPGLCQGKTAGIVNV